MFVSKLITFKRNLNVLFSERFKIQKAQSIIPCHKGQKSEINIYMV